MKLLVHHFDLRLRHPFGISRNTMSVQPTIIVELQAGGLSGYGEATTNSYYGVTIDSLRQSISSVQTLLAEMTANDPQECWQALSERLPDDSFALCALDMAVWDLHGKLQGKPLYEIWGLDPTTGPLSNYTIGIDTLPRMLEKMREQPNWPIYKIKVGTPEDLATVTALRNETAATFRVDANCGWQPEQILELAAQLKSLGVEFIEQPLSPDQDSELTAIAKSRPLPLAADESCCRLEDIPRCAENGYSIANIKLVKCGGITAALQMIESARKHNMKVMVGCMTESTVGISAIGHLRPMLDYVDMDGAALLAEDIADGVKVVDGVCKYANRGGTGANLKRC